MNKENLKIITRRFYLGLTTSIEEKSLFEEIRNNPLAHSYFKDFEKEFLEKNIYSTESNKIWKAFYSQHLDSKKIGRRRLLQVISRYAAVVVVAVFLAGGLLFLNEWRQAKQPIAWYEAYAPRGEKTILTLPDGTTVWLNAESTLKYPANQLKDKRIMQLSGEAFFHVTENKDAPFIVQTSEFDVVVKGTSFNVMAYDDFDRTETALLSGAIEIKNIKGREPGTSVIIEPGEKIVFKKENETLRIINADLVEEAAWKDNLFMFTDVKFEELCQRLERWYDVNIIIDDKELNHIRYTGNFRNEETIWQVLDIIKITTPIEYTLKDRQLIIFKER